MPATPPKKKKKDKVTFIEELKLRKALTEVRDRVMADADKADLPEKKRKYNSVLGSFKK